MTQYNTLNAKLSNSPLNKLKSVIKHKTEVSLNLSSNFIENSNDETNFSHKLILADTQVSKVRKAFANGLSANKIFSKTQLPNMIQSRGILGELLVVSYEALSAETQELIKRAPELTKDATRYFVNKGINKLKKDFTLSECSVITLRNNEIKDIMKVIKSLEKRGILLKWTTTKITSQEKGFLNFLRPLITAHLPLMEIVHSLH